jgi:hypothetical protein
MKPLNNTIAINWLVNGISGGTVNVHDLLNDIECTLNKYDITFISGYVAAVLTDQFSTGKGSAVQIDLALPADIEVLLQQLAVRQGLYSKLSDLGIDRVRMIKAIRQVSRVLLKDAKNSVDELMIRKSTSISIPATQLTMSLEDVTEYLAAIREFNQQFKQFIVSVH